MELPIKTGILEVSTICIDNCTDEERYINPDSHFIHIPKKVYLDWMEFKDREGRSTNPLYVGIRNSNNVEKRLYFGRVEPSVNSSNSNHEMCLLPRWVIEKLEIDEFGGLVDIVYVKNPPTIDYIKVRGNKSSYVNFRDIKSMLEQKLCVYNCLNIDEKIHIEDVIFNVIEIKDIHGNSINFGSIFNTDVKIDFDLPDDLVEKAEEQRKLASITKIPDSKGRQLQFGSHVHTMNDNEEKEEKSTYVPFQGPGLKMVAAPDRKMTKEELRRFNADRFTKLAEKKEN